MITTTPLTLRAEDLVGSTRRTALLLAAAILSYRADRGARVEISAAMAREVAAALRELAALRGRGHGA